MRSISFLCLCIFILSIGCKKVYPTTSTVVNNDTTIVVHNDTTIIVHDDTTIYQGAKQYAISIPGITIFTADTLYHLSTSTSINPRFNIDYYPGIDSAFFEAYFLVPGVSNTLQVELYNFTDSLPITGSLLSSGYSPDVTKAQTGNMISGFPHKEIELGVRIKQSEPINYTAFMGGTLWLYKKQ